MSKLKEFSMMRKCSGVEKALLRYSVDKSEEIRILEMLLNLRKSSSIE